MRRLRRPSRRLLVVGVIVATASAGAIFHLGGDEGSTPPVRGTVRHVDGYVKVAETRRIVVEAADGRLHTLEVDRRRLEALDVAHIRAHSHLGHAMRLHYVKDDGRAWLVETRDLDDFPGVGREPARHVNARETAGVREGQSRDEVVELLGPALVAGFGDTFEGRRADCWQWALRGPGERRFVACFDTDSDPAVLGTFTRPA